MYVKAEIPILHINMPLTHLLTYLWFRRKNPHWDRKSLDDHGSTASALFAVENTDGEIWFTCQRLFNLIQPLY